MRRCHGKQNEGGKCVGIFCRRRTTFVKVLNITSLVVVFVTGGIWWITWPDRTANSFITNLHQRRLEEARKLMRHVNDDETFVIAREAPLRDWFALAESRCRFPVEVRALFDYSRMEPDELVFIPESRSLLDIILCRRGFWRSDVPEFEAVRGKIQ